MAANPVHLHPIALYIHAGRGIAFLSMKATRWEFENRAWLFGMVFAVSFPLYSLDHANSAQALANWMAGKLSINGDLLTRVFFTVAAVVLVLSALIRTWASSYLRGAVVYASEVKTAALVADGPYRHVRNPLYFGNVLMAMGMGALMSRSGFLGVWCGHAGLLLSLDPA